MASNRAQSVGVALKNDVNIFSYWSIDNVYAKQNGGDFDFIIEPDAWKGLVCFI